MGFKNHELFIQQNRPLFKGPFLEIGSKDYGSTVNLRNLFPGEAYLGADMSPGKGVDQIIDFTRSFAQIDAVLEGRRFNTIFCLSVLEHCEQPFLMAEHITRLLESAGCLYVSVPYAWKFHGYPSDYWRFTPAGVKKLFPGLEFDETTARLATDVVGDFRIIDQDLSRMKLKGSWFRNRGQPLRSLSADLLALLGRAGMLRWLTQHRYLIPPTCIEMIGRPIAEAAASKP
jgi:hypothetical protein